MAKITDYIENASPDPESVYTIIAYAGQNYKVKIGNFGVVEEHQRQIPIIAEFLGESTFGLSIPGSITLSTEANHPGYTTGGNYPILSYYTLKFIGGETLEFITKPTGSTQDYFGFGLPSSIVSPGESFVAFLVAASGVSGHCRNLGTNSQTPSNISTLSTSTWYRFKIAVNSTITRVDFFVYDLSGNLLWSDSVSSNIPSVVTNASLMSNVAQQIQIDWLAIYNTTLFTR